MIEVNIKDNESLERALRRFKKKLNALVYLKMLKEKLSMKSLALQRELPKNKPLEEQ